MRLNPNFVETPKKVIMSLGVWRLLSDSDYDILYQAGIRQVEIFEDGVIIDINEY